MLSTLFFLQAHAIALWFVPFSTVLQGHGLGWLTPYAFAATGVAAFISPMLTGVLADRHLSATRLLRYMSLAISVSLVLTFLAIERRWSGGWILGLVQIQQLCSAPAWGLTSMIVLARLPDPARQFGAIRAWATYGWLVAGLIISLVLAADSSTLCGFTAAAAWLVVAGFTYFLPDVSPQVTRAGWRWRDLLGLETFVLLRHPRHRAVFVTAGLLSIPLAAFYAYTPLHLQDLGITKVSAVMSLGQVTEALAMYALAPLLARCRLQTLFSLAILTSTLRYALFAVGHPAGVFTGIALHGICFTFFFIPAQIYIEQRIDRTLRFRAQALMTLLVGGFGNLLGYLGCGWWRAACVSGGQTFWREYWGGLTVAVVLVGAYFAWAYRGLEPQIEPASVVEELGV